MIDKIKLIENIHETMPLIHKKLLREIHIEGYNKHQVWLMSMLKKHEGKPMKFYGHKMMVNKSNFSNLVESLIIEGMIKRVNGVDDRRIINLFLTDKGQEFFENYKSQISGVFLKKLDFLSEDDLEVLDSSIVKIKKIFEKIE